MPFSALRPYACVSGAIAPYAPGPALQGRARRLERSRVSEQRQVSTHIRARLAQGLAQPVRRRASPSWPDQRHPGTCLLLVSRGDQEAGGR